MESAIDAALSSKSAGKRLIDTTCPLVARAHRAARMAEANRFVVVIGRLGHVEVQGIVGDLENLWWYPDRSMYVVILLKGLG